MKQFCKWPGGNVRVRLPVLFCACVLLSLLALLAGCASSPSPSPTPTAVPPTATATLAPTPTSTPGGLEQAATAYYRALQAQNYTLAYSFLDPNIVINGQHLTLSAFTQKAKARYTQYGAIQSFSVSPFLPVTTVTVIRATYAYHAHLTPKLEQGRWKFTSFDLI